jgi:hypothetical protein
VIRERLFGVNNLFAKGGYLVTSPFGEHQNGSALKVRRLLHAATPAMSAQEFFDHLDRACFLTAYAVPLNTPGFQPFTDGFGKFEFVDIEKSPPRTQDYKSRVFIYKNGYTDWHFHSTDEALTLQLLNRKEFLLLPTDKGTFREMWNKVKDRPSWDSDEVESPGFRRLCPYRAVLEPGDAVYIPVFWWHAVEAIDNDLGATLAFTFASPLDVQLDPRFAAARWNFRQALASRRHRRHLPKMILGAFAALARHPFRPEYLNQDQLVQ